MMGTTRRVPSVSKRLASPALGSEPDREPATKSGDALVKVSAM
jgi:hypothetical protein